jgi:membrane associated rhomboid family serine protease
MPAKERFSRRSFFRAAVRPQAASSAVRLGIRQRLKQQALLLLAMVALLWSMELVDTLLLGQSLNQHGIHPRTLSGLRGVAWAPLLHADLGHLAANTLPLVVLGWLVLLRGWRHFAVVSLWTAIASGLGVWLVGSRSTVHLGASGVIFGYLGYLILRGYFDRRLISIAISLLVGILYGGLIWGVLPLDDDRSWEGHLLGFLSGALIARLLTGRRNGWSNSRM